MSSLVYVTPGGQQVLYLVDFINADVIVPSIIIMEIIVVSYIYGIDRFTYDVNFMLNKELGIGFKILLGVIIPLTVVGFYIYFFVNFPDLEYNGVLFPRIAIAAMWMLVVISWIAVPMAMIYYILSAESESISQKLYNGFNPTIEWGPQDINERHVWSKSPPDFLTFKRCKLIITSKIKFWM